MPKRVQPSNTGKSSDKAVVRTAGEAAVEKVVYRASAAQAAGRAPR